MSKPVAETGHGGDALRERVRQVAERFSQAEIARRAGVSRANVHRYLRAGKIPVDFAASLVREFGVSPVWLLQGEGAMLASQVTQAAAEESRRLLEVVLKLNAVGHEKLAALREDDAARGMRALSDALARHEQLRAKLAERAKPLYTKLLNEARDALAATRVQEAEVSLAGAAQLDRIINQPQLTAARNMLEGTLATYLGDFERQRRNHLGALGSLMQAGKLRDRQFLRTCYNYCAGLGNAGRLHEAARTADAMLLLAGKNPPEWTEDWLLQVPRAYLLLHTSRLVEALPILARVLAGCTDEVRPYVQDLLSLAHFLAGAPARLEGLLPGNELHGLLIALLDPSSGTLQRLLDQTRGQLPDSSRQYLKVAHCISAGWGNVGWSEVAEPATAFVHAVLETELRRRRGQSAMARKLCLAARKRLAQLDAAITPDFAALALHHLQASALLTGRPAIEARVWLQQRIQDGYLCLRSNLQPISDTGR
jgi:transcriptional regulator with XRE-family HTH domain